MRYLLTKKVSIFSMCVVYSIVFHALDCPLFASCNFYFTSLFVAILCALLITQTTRLFRAYGIRFGNIIILFDIIPYCMH